MIWNIQKIKNKMSGVNAVILITSNVDGLNNSFERKDCQNELKESGIP